MSGASKRNYLATTTTVGRLAHASRCAQQPAQSDPYGKRHRVLSPLISVSGVPYKEFERVRNGEETPVTLRIKFVGQIIAFKCMPNVGDPTPALNVELADDYGPIGTTKLRFQKHVRWKLDVSQDGPRWLTVVLTRPSGLKPKGSGARSKKRPNRG